MSFWILVTIAFLVGCVCSPLLACIASAIKWGLPLQLGVAACDALQAQPAPAAPAPALPVARRPPTAMPASTTVVGLPGATAALSLWDLYLLYQDLLRCTLPHGNHCSA
eukprot:3762778-Rhodomonas_salina.1